MTRQAQIKHLAEKGKISVFNNEKNYLSYFIIPIPHKAFDQKQKTLFDNIEQLDWEILNEKERALDSNKDIKKYIYENLIPPLNKKESEKNIVLRKKLKQNKFTFILDKNIEIIINETDLWILEGNVGFFVIKITLPVNSDLNVNDISTLINRHFRDFRNIFISSKHNEIVYDRYIDYIEIKRWTDKINKISDKRVINKHNLRYFQIHKFSTDKISYFTKPFMPLTEYLLNLTKINGKSFLNIDENDFNGNEFYPVFHSSYYAKMLTAVHIEIKPYVLSKIETPEINELKTIEIDGTDVLEEMPFLLATASEMYPTKTWEANENYINNTVNLSGINIWKYWSGIAIKDSLAFFSVNDGGGMIVSSCKENVYFLYMLNLYVNYRIKLLEHLLVKNRDFFDIEDAYVKLEEVQKLHNLYMSEEIATRFQPNEIHKAILNGLNTKSIFEEVENNIVKTYERTKDNTDILIGITMGFAGFIGTFLSKDLIIEAFKHHLYISLVATTVLFGIVLFLIIKRKKVISKIVSLKKYLKRNK